MEGEQRGVRVIIQHFGVKGMHWGVRKVMPLAPGITRSMHKTNIQNHGQRGARRINAAVAKGTPLATARSNESMRRARNRTAALVGAAAILTYGPELSRNVNDLVRTTAGAKREQAGREAAQHIFADNRGITNFESINLSFNPSTNTWE
jgi:hypothetical protein